MSTASGSSKGRKKQRAIDERYEKRDAGAEHDRKVDTWIKVFAGGCALLTLFGFLAQLQGSLLNKSYVQLSVEYPVQLQDVLFGGHPWVVLCTDSKNAVDEEGRISDRVVKIFDVLNEKYSVQAGVLDCSQKLPSGKSVYGRLGMKRSRKNPIMFLAHAGDKPSVIPAGKYSDNIEVRRKSGGNVIKHVSNLIRARTEAKVMKNTNNLRKYCSGRKYCGLFTIPGKVTEHDKQVMKSLQWKFPHFYWAVLDVSLNEFSMTKYLHGRGAKSPGFLAFRRGGTADTGFDQHFGAPAESSWSELNSLEEHVIDSFLKEFTLDSYPSPENRLRKPPSIRTIKRSSKTKAPKSTKKPAKKSSKRAASSKASSGSGESAEDRLARERQRRREMEQEQSQHFAEYVESDDIESWENDEDVLNLDDTEGEMDNTDDHLDLDDETLDLDGDDDATLDLDNDNESLDVDEGDEEEVGFDSSQHEL